MTPMFSQHDSSHTVGVKYWIWVGQKFLGMWKSALFDVSLICLVNIGAEDIKNAIVDVYTVLLFGRAML